MKIEYPFTTGQFGISLPAPAGSSFVATHVALLVFQNCNMDLSG